MTHFIIEINSYFIWLLKRYIYPAALNLKNDLKIGIIEKNQLKFNQLNLAFFYISKSFRNFMLQIRSDLLSQ